MLIGVVFALASGCGNDPLPVVPQESDAAMAEPRAGSTELARSAQDRPILARRWNPDTGSPVLIFSGIHGDERSAVELAHRLEKRWDEDPSRLQGIHVLFIPVLNPDGWLANVRGNANGVDLNRNFPDDWSAGNAGEATYGGSEPLSEPESTFLFTLVNDEQPRQIMAIHSCRSCGGMNNYDGPAGEIAGIMAAENGYVPSDQWLEETPGSFGTFAGKVGQIPTVTLEIPREVASEEEWEANIRAVEAFVRESAPPPAPTAGQRVPQSSDP